MQIETEIFHATNEYNQFVVSLKLYNTVMLINMQVLQRL